jgi:simple sugar transport system ATP-binding protein
VNAGGGSPAIEARAISKRFGQVEALHDVTLTAPTGAVTCLLGDNGAGKSTLIKVLSGVFRPDSGDLLVQGSRVSFASPRHALDAGVSTVFQDLATIPLMSIVRNFFLGREPLRSTHLVDWDAAERTTRAALGEMGITLRDGSQPVGTLSGGERQSLAIARALHFGASVLILDEPTSALGVREAANALRHVETARDRGIAVILITHNVTHAYAVGDNFVVLDHGTVTAERSRAEVTSAELQELMSGSQELQALLRSPGPSD